MLVHALVQRLDPLVRSTIEPLARVVGDTVRIETVVAGEPLRFLGSLASIAVVARSPEVAQVISATKRYWLDVVYFQRSLTGTHTAV
jgi:hypothetical protein